MSEENKESPIVPVSMDSWVEWFRSVAPHIHSIRGKTIVIDLAGETILQEHFSSLIADISMISAIGARIVLVYGVRPQVEELMSLKAIESQYVNGIRVTTADALVCVKEAAGEARLLSGLTEHSDGPQPMPSRQRKLRDCPSFRHHRRRGL